MLSLADFEARQSKYKFHGELFGEAAIYSIVKTVCSTAVLFAVKSLTVTRRR